MARTPKLLRSRQRAVTAEDFEFMAEQALPGHIGRVKCIQPTRLDPGVTNPGQIHVLLIPKVELAAGYLEPNWLDVPNEDMEVVRDFLDRHRLLTTRLNIAPPAYHWVAVTIDLYAPTGVDRSALRDAVLRRLYAFLNPLTGGPGGDGWPFGRDLYEMDVYQCLQGVSDQLIIRELTMESVEMPSESRAKRTLIDVLGHGVIASHRHTVNFV